MPIHIAPALLLLAAFITATPVLADSGQQVPALVFSSAGQPKSFMYGTSVEGRSLEGIVFGSGPSKILIMASIHGNERDTRPLAEKLIAYLKATPATCDGATVMILPCVNPDGWAASTRTNAHQVDLNRNFPVGWHANMPDKPKRGSAPLSEPESAALAKVIEKFQPEKIVSIHNPLDMLDHSGKQGLAFAKIIAAQDGYNIPSGGVGYPTPGSFGQFAEKEGVAAIVTLELPRESPDDAWSQNKSALLAAIRWQPAQ